MNEQDAKRLAAEIVHRTGYTEASPNWISDLERNIASALLDALRESEAEVARLKAEERRLRDCILSARWRLAKGRPLWNGPCHECNAALERGLRGDDLRASASNKELVAMNEAPPPADAMERAQKLQQDILCFAALVVAEQAAYALAIEDACTAALGHDPDRRTTDPVAIGYIQGRKDAASDVRALAAPTERREPT